MAAPSPKRSPDLSGTTPAATDEASVRPTAMRHVNASAPQSAQTGKGGAVDEMRVRRAKQERYAVGGARRLLLRSGTVGVIAESPAKQEPEGEGDVGLVGSVCRRIAQGWDRTVASGVYSRMRIGHQGTICSHPWLRR